MTHILHTSAVAQICIKIADEGNSASCQSSGAHNINLWRITALEGHHNTDAHSDGV